jgi:Transposase DDE domain
LPAAIDDDAEVEVALARNRHAPRERHPVREARQLQPLDAAELVDVGGRGRGRDLQHLVVEIVDPFELEIEAGGRALVERRQGPLFRRAVNKILKSVNVEIVKRSDRAKGFVVLPKRWVVERTFAWLGRCRRLAKDWENLNRKGLAFLRLASIRLMPRKLCNPA